MDRAATWVKDTLLSILTSLESFLTSPLGMTILGTAVAAFAGAYGAHVIAERGRRRESLHRELKVTNAAIMVAYEICHSFISLKEQYIRELKNDFDASLADHAEFLERRRQRQIPPDQPYNLRMNLVLLSPMAVPHDILVRQVFEQTSVGDRACMVASVLLRSIDSLNKAIEQRNELLQEYREDRDKWQDRPDCFYFGNPNQDGHTDERYPHAVLAISSLTDDCIQFSWMLCTDLMEHGEALHRKLGKRAEQVNKPNLVKAEEAGLMPDPTNYKQWETGFRKRST